MLGVHRIKKKKSSQNIHFTYLCKNFYKWVQAKRQGQREGAGYIKCQSHGERRISVSFEEVQDNGQRHSSVFKLVFLQHRERDAGLWPLRLFRTSDRDIDQSSNLSLSCSTMERNKYFFFFLLWSLKVIKTVVLWFCTAFWMTHGL